MSVPRDHTRLLGELAEEYARRSPRSAALNQRALRSMIDGGSHPLRLIQPFPPRIVRASGSRIIDEDGHEILDFWQGHFANILGHNPQVVTSSLGRAFDSGSGLQSGFADQLQIEVAEIVCRRTGAERVRFTTTGALATMNAILLARAFTGRERVMKIGGGWHGAQPWGLMGVHFAGGGRPWTVESQGLPDALTRDILTTRYNDPEILRDHFRQHGDRLACFILEPFMGAGGFMPATREYLRSARELADRYGAVLVFDEVVSGFRFHAGDLGSLYGVRPDLAAFAKILGGGMPVAAVAGRADILGLCGREGGNRVAFPGGTYSGHPASMLAAKAVLSYLVENEQDVYPRIAELGARMRRTMEAAFTDEGILARCTGFAEGVLPGSSFAVPHFPLDGGRELLSPEDVNDPALCDSVLRDRVLQMALLAEDVHLVHGGGAACAAHTEADIATLGDACRRAARRIRRFL